MPLFVTLDSVGFREYNPQNAAGILRLPFWSVPTANGTHLAATSPASPPLQPPHDLEKLNGFRDSPKTRFFECKPIPPAGTLP